MIPRARLQQKTASSPTGPREQGYALDTQQKGLQIQYGLEQREYNRHRCDLNPLVLILKPTLTMLLDYNLKWVPLAHRHPPPPNPSSQPQTKKSSHQTFSFHVPTLVILDQLLFPNQPVLPAPASPQASESPAPFSVS